MKNTSPSVIKRWLQGALLAAGLCAGSANAAVYTGVWDPTYGSPFLNLGWRGTAEYFVPNECEPTGTADIYNASACSGNAIVTQAEVEFYDINAAIDTGTGAQPTISTLVFNPSSLVIGTLRYVSGELTQLTTSFSNYMTPTEDLSAFGVYSNTEFSLFFTLDGPRLAWRECYSYYEGEGSFTASHYYEPECAFGVNDAQQFPATFEITRVPEPGTLALACLALLALTPRFRAALLARR